MFYINFPRGKALRKILIPFLINYAKIRLKDPINLKKAVDQKMDTSFGQELQVAREAARRAGEIIMEQQGKASVAEKGKDNLVTEADLAAQEAIIKIIRRHFPEHDIMAEESEATAKSDAAHLWIIDPLDGTNNFAHTIPHFSVSIAYARSGRVLAGVIFDPPREEMFTAARDAGAFLNDHPLRVSATGSLREAIVATGFYYDRDVIMRKTLAAIEKLFAANIHGIRRFGSAALDLSWVACGRFDAFFEYSLATWDFAAGMLIIEEAGGRCTDHKGEPLDLNSKGIAVSNGQFHEDFLKVIAW